MKIICKKCGACCKTRYGIKLKKEEAEKIKQKEIVSGSAKIKTKNSFCILLDKKLCSEYSKRPSVCKSYPFVSINGKIILECNCLAIKEVFKKGITFLTREQINKMPFLKNALKIIEQEKPNLKNQTSFMISNH